MRKYFIKLLSIIAVTMFAAQAGNAPAAANAFTQQKKTWNVHCDKLTAASRWTPAGRSKIGDRTSGVRSATPQSARALPPGRSINGVIEQRARPGDRIVIHGNCVESVTIPAHKPGLTLDGKGTGVIEGAGQFGINVLANGTILKNLTVEGGGFGIAVNQGSATIQNSTVRLATSIGIIVQNNGSATIVRSTIENNRRSGIEVTTGGYANIGDTTRPGQLADGNLIRNNGVSPGLPNYPFATGVKVKRNSQVTVIGNTIVGNTGGGISIREQSFGLVTANLINSNGYAAPAFIGGFGILLSEQSLINFDRDLRDDPKNYPNTTTPGLENAGYGFVCQGLSTYAGFYDVNPDGTEAINRVTGEDGDLNIAATCSGRFFSGMGPPSF